MDISLFCLHQATLTIGSLRRVPLPRRTPIHPRPQGKNHQCEEARQLKTSYLDHHLIPAIQTIRPDNPTPVSSRSAPRLIQRINIKFRPLLPRSPTTTHHIHHNRRLGVQAHRRPLRQVAAAIKSRDHLVSSVGSTTSICLAQAQAAAPSLPTSSLLVQVLVSLILRRPRVVRLVLRLLRDHGHCSRDSRVRRSYSRQALIVRSKRIGRHWRRRRRSGTWRRGSLEVWVVI